MSFVRTVCMLLLFMNSLMYARLNVWISLMWLALALAVWKWEGIEKERRGAG